MIRKSLDTVQNQSLKRSPSDSSILRIALALLFAFTLCWSSDHSAFGDISTSPQATDDEEICGFIEDGQDHTTAANTIGILYQLTVVEFESDGQSSAANPQLKPTEFFSDHPKVQDFLLEAFFHKSLICVKAEELEPGVMFVVFARFWDKRSGVSVSNQ